MDWPRIYANHLDVNKLEKSMILPMRIRIVCAGAATGIYAMSFGTVPKTDCVCWPRRLICEQLGLNVYTEAVFEKMPFKQRFIERNFGLEGSLAERGVPTELS